MGGSLDDVVDLADETRGRVTENGHTLVVVAPRTVRETRGTPQARYPPGERLGDVPMSHPEDADGEVCRAGDDLPQPAPFVHAHDQRGRVHREREDRGGGHSTR